LASCSWWAWFLAIESYRVSHFAITRVKANFFAIERWTRAGQDSEYKLNEQDVAFGIALASKAVLFEDMVDFLVLYNYLKLKVTSPETNFEMPVQEVPLKIFNVGKFSSTYIF